MRDAAWFGAYGQGIYGYVKRAGRTRSVKVPDTAFPVGFDYNVGAIVVSGGYLWEFTTDESVAKIDPISARSCEPITYRSYDPSYGAGLNGLAACCESASRPAGRPARSRESGRRRAPRPALRVYSTPGAVRVPIMNQLIRIDPALMPVWRIRSVSAHAG